VQNLSQDRVVVDDQNLHAIIRSAWAPTPSARAIAAAGVPGAIIQNSVRIATLPGSEG
jgi:hypothetical protein